MAEPDPPAGPHFRTTVLDLVTGEPIHDATVQQVISSTTNLIVSDREGKATIPALGTAETLEFNVYHSDYLVLSPVIITQPVLAHYNSANQPFVTYLIRPSDYGTVIPSDVPLEEASPHIVYLHRSDFTAASDVTFPRPVPTTPSVARDADGRFVESGSPGEDGVLLFPHMMRGTMLTSCIGPRSLAVALSGFSASSYYLCE